MNIKTKVCILRNRLCYDRASNITVKGNSMFPLIKSGEKVRLVEKKDYRIGDIVVFYYSETEKLVVHRVVLKYGGNLYCKGDNSFALEKISESDIIGCVTHIKKGDDLILVPKATKEFIARSLQVNLVYCQLNCNKDKVMETDIYRNYKKQYLDSEKYCDKAAVPCEADI